MSVLVWPIAAAPFVLPGLEHVAAWCFLPLIVALAHAGGLATAFLSSRPIVWLGTVSYSIYMVHYFVRDRLLNLFDLAGMTRIDEIAGGTRKVVDVSVRIGLDRLGIEVGLGAALVLALTIALTLMVSAATYALIERPFMRGGRAIA